MQEWSRCKDMFLTSRWEYGEGLWRRYYVDDNSANSEWSGLTAKFVYFDIRYHNVDRYRCFWLKCMFRCCRTYNAKWWITRTAATTDPAGGTRKCFCRCLSLLYSKLFFIYNSCTTVVLTLRFSTARQWSLWGCRDWI